MYICIRCQNADETIKAQKDMARTWYKARACANVTMHIDNDADDDDDADAPTERYKIMPERPACILECRSQVLR